MTSISARRFNHVESDGIANHERTRPMPSSAPLASTNTMPGQDCQHCHRSRLHPISIDLNEFAHRASGGDCRLQCHRFPRGLTAQADAGSDDQGLSGKRILAQCIESIARSRTPFLKLRQALASAEITSHGRRHRPGVAWRVAWRVLVSVRCPRPSALMIDGHVECLVQVGRATPRAFCKKNAAADSGNANAMATTVMVIACSRAGCCTPVRPSEPSKNLRVARQRTFAGPSWGERDSWDRDTAIAQARCDARRNVFDQMHIVCGDHHRDSRRR